MAIELIARTVAGQAGLVELKVACAVRCGFPLYKNQRGNAIYKVEGKTLTLAGNEPGNATVPTAFERGGVDHTRVFVFNKQ